MAKRQQMEIRQLKKEETGVLETMLYEAIYQPEGSKPLAREIIREPNLWVYIDAFGTLPADECLVAEVEGWIVGAVWARILPSDHKGYGYVDAHTPELAISLLKEYRHKGIGTQLMKAMLRRLRERGYQRASLSVTRENANAIRLYEKLGFSTLKKTKKDCLMVAVL